MSTDSLRRRMRENVTAARLTLGTAKENAAPPDAAMVRHAIAIFAA